MRREAQGLHPGDHCAACDCTALQTRDGVVCGCRPRRSVPGARLDAALRGLDVFVVPAGVLEGLELKPGAVQPIESGERT